MLQKSAKINTWGKTTPNTEDAHCSIMAKVKTKTRTKAYPTPPGVAQ